MDVEKCSEITSRKQKCKNNAVEKGLCSFHYNKKYKTKEIIEHNGLTKECEFNKHKNSDSKYPKERVPIEHFFKADKSPNNLYKRCKDCREYKSNSKNRYIKMNEKLQKDSNYGVCCSDCHDLEGVSNFSRFQIPISMFDMKNGRKSNICSDCRKHQNKIKTKNREILRNKVVKEENFFCVKCNKILEIKQRAPNLDGSPSSHCWNCKEKEKECNKKIYSEKKQLLREIKLEKMYKIGASCQICKNIFLQPVEKTGHQRELITYVENEMRYVDYENKKYTSFDFLKKFENILELRTIDLDHLSEKEQRERGIIGPDDIFLEKKGKVNEMQNKNQIIEEAKKTQIVCCKCHVIVTIKRERGGGFYTKNYIEKEQYVKKLRRNGCQMCGFFDESILRYFEFDHIDPKNKKIIISDIIRIEQYTIKDLLEEIQKCRVLCRPCHRIHTSEQKKMGLI